MRSDRASQRGLEVAKLMEEGDVIVRLLTGHPDSLRDLGDLD